MSKEDVLFDMHWMFVKKSEVGKLRDDNKRLLDQNIGRAREANEVDQILGKALGYPLYYPDVSDVDDGMVCTGEHVLASLAQEAVDFMHKQCDLTESVQRLSDERAERIIDLEAQVENLDGYAEHVSEESKEAVTEIVRLRRSASIAVSISILFGYLLGSLVVWSLMR